MRSEEDEGTGWVEGKGGVKVPCAGYMQIHGMNARANAAASVSASPSAPVRQSPREPITEARDIKCNPSLTIVTTLIPANHNL